MLDNNRKGGCTVTDYTVNLTVHVLDLVSQVRDATLINVYLDVRNPGGVGISELGVYGQGEGNGQFSL